MSTNDGKLSPFDFVNSVTYNKKDLMREQDNFDHQVEKQYNPFVVNRSLSYFYDTSLYANEMNKYHHLDSKLQYSYLLNSIRKRKRFSKWLKHTDLDSVNVVKEYYGYSAEKARSVVELLSQDQIHELSKRMDKGGKRKR